MTNMARISRTRRPDWLDWNAWAVPEKLVVMLDRSVCCATRCTWATAVPMATPSRKSNEMVTDGSCPEWLTLSGPALDALGAVAGRGRSAPLFGRMDSRL